MDKAISLLNRLVDTVEKNNSFWQHIEKRAKKGDDKIAVTNILDLGIYERNQRSLLKIAGVFPNWREIVSDTLVEMFPEKKNEIEKILNDKSSTSLNDDKSIPTLEILKHLPPFSTIQGDLKDFIISHERDNFIASVKEKHIELWSVEKLREYLKKGSIDKASLYRACSFSIADCGGEEGLLFNFLLISFQYIQDIGNVIKDEKVLSGLRNIFFDEENIDKTKSQRFTSSIRTLNGRIGYLFGEKNETTGRDKPKYSNMLFEGTLQKKGFIFHLLKKDIFKT